MVTISMQKGIQLLLTFLLIGIYLNSLWIVDSNSKDIVD